MAHKTTITLQWDDKFYVLLIKQPYFEKNIVLHAFKGLDLLNDKPKIIRFYPWGSDTPIDEYSPEDGFLEKLFGGSIEFSVQRELNSKGSGLYIELKHQDFPVVLWLNDQELRIFLVKGYIKSI